MIPSDIGPHPAAPDWYVNVGAAPSMGEDCVDLAVRIVGATPDKVKVVPARMVTVPGSGERVYPGFMSEWYPTPDEIERINAGYPVRMLQVGDELSPSNLWVRGTDEV